MDPSENNENAPIEVIGKPKNANLVQRGMALAALGVVFGDIGTSPLYSFDAACAFADKAALDSDVLGIISLFFWSLFFVVTVKYLIFIMRADNEGEGGVFALSALLQDHFSDSKKIPFLFLLVAFGGALLVGDGIITPSISVLGAMEGLEVIDPGFGTYVVPFTIIVLVVLFGLQRLGTGGLGMIFGPIMLVWFLVIGGMGLYQLFLHGVNMLDGRNPIHGIEFLRREQLAAFGVLGAVVLCVTGAEALYADMGHFGRTAIRRAWLFVAMPALVLNYLGQGALVLGSEVVHGNLFFNMIPSGWWTYALVALATTATIIASQAIISGVFSLTRQAIQMRFWPNIPIVHTSEKVEAQIYIPLVNLFLGVACVATVLFFQSSANLAAAYGIAVTGTMAITSVAYFYVRWKVWRKSLLLSIVLVASFLVVDFAFLFANLTKLDSGGWYPLVVALLLFSLMAIWRIGRWHIARGSLSRQRELTEVLEEIKTGGIHEVPGLAVYLTPHYRAVPPSLDNLLRFYGTLRANNIILVPRADFRPRVPGNGIDRIEKVAKGFYRVSFRFGYRERPNLVRLIYEIRDRTGTDFPMDNLVFHFSRERVFPVGKSGMPRPLKPIFSLLSRNSQPNHELMIYPPRKTFEVITPVYL